MAKEMQLFECNKYHWDSGYKFKELQNSFAIIPTQSVSQKTMFAPKTVSNAQHHSNGKVIVMVEEWFVKKFESENQVKLS